MQNFLPYNLLGELFNENIMPVSSININLRQVFLPIYFCHLFTCFK